MHRYLPALFLTYGREVAYVPVNDRPRLAGRSNAVSKLHRDVSRDMFADLWPDVPQEETPIGSVTNGVHASTWVAPEMAELLSRYVLPEWHEAVRADRFGAPEAAAETQVI